MAEAFGASHRHTERQTAILLALFSDVVRNVNRDSTSSNTTDVDVPRLLYWLSTSIDHQRAHVYISRLTWEKNRRWIRDDWLRVYTITNHIQSTDDALASIGGCCSACQSHPRLSSQRVFPNSNQFETDRIETGAVNYFFLRDAMLSAVYAVVVCLSVCLSLRYCIKRAKRRITQIMLYDSPRILVFWHRSSRRNSNSGVG